MKIGIFGGTFAPAHNGHVSMAKCAINQLDLDKLIVMPNGLPPHKENVLDKNDRFQIATLAFADIPKVEISDYELKKEGTDYSYITLEYLKSLFPNDQLYFVMGGDSLRDFPLWKNPQRIAELAILAVAERKSAVTTQSVEFIKKQYSAQVVLLDFKPIDLSSTQLRTRYRLGQDNSEYLPKAVDAYVRQKGLFFDCVQKVGKLKTLVNPKRFEHTLSVVEAGIHFAKPSGVSEEKAFWACLLHDCGKNIPAEEWERYDFCNQEKLLPSILHCGLGVKVAQIDFGIKDEEILDAIRYHTTAKPNMSRLSKLVFVADKAEKTREYDTSQYYSTALVNLDKAFKMVLFDMYQIALKKYGAEMVDKVTLSAVKYYEEN